MIDVLFPPRRIRSPVVDLAEVRRRRELRQEAEREEKLVADEQDRIALLVKAQEEDLRAALGELAEETRIARAEGRATADLEAEIATITALLEQPIA